MNATPSPSWSKQACAEAVGTFLLVFFGCGVVHTAVLLDAQQGVWQVAVVWGIAIMLAIYSIGGVSGGHLNPAMTLAFWWFRRFPTERVVPYIAGQLIGAFTAAAALYLIFAPQLSAKEQAKGVIRGQAGSEITAMCYGEFFPNPGGLAAGDGPYSATKHEQLRLLVPAWLAFFAELLGTAVLAFVVFAVTDDRNSGRPAAGQAPIFIGLTVSALISVIGPLTQACFNPARDFAPRLFAYFAGWGTIAFQGTSDWGWLTVYILAPIAGALIGGGYYERFTAPSRS